MKPSRKMMAIIARVLADEFAKRIKAVAKHRKIDPQDLLDGVNAELGDMWIGK